MKDVQRADGRSPDALRPIGLEAGFLRHAEGSCLVAFGETRVICAASVTEGVPPWRRGSGKGWLTAEYAMLPRSGMERIPRTHVGRGRAQEIQRMIGRALRSAVDLDAIGEHTVTIDCDVLEADGGTRTAAITGGAVALRNATAVMKARGMVKTDPFRGFVAAVSVGLVETTPMLDLCYAEDARADVDMNLVMNEAGEIIEVQGAAEGVPFSREELDRLLSLGVAGIETLVAAQRTAASGGAGGR